MQRTTMIRRTGDVAMGWQRTGGVYTEDVPKIAYEIALLGGTEEAMARTCGVSIDTFKRWRKQRDELEMAIWNGQEAADARVAESLYRCAVGYEYEEDYVANYKGQVQVVRVTKYSRPDADAARRWLQARKKDVWGDKPGPGTQMVINVQQNYDFSALSTEELAVAKKLLMQNYGVVGDTTTDVTEMED